MKSKASNTGKNLIEKILAELMKQEIIVHKKNAMD